MKYLGKVSDPKDLATKEYVDSKVSGATGTVTSVNGVGPDSTGNVALIGENIPYAAGSTSTVKSEIDDRQMDTKKLEAETAIADEDAFPFYDASEAINRKTLWSNIVAKLKNLFLSLTGGTVTGRIQNTYASGSGIEITHADAGADCGLSINKASSDKSGAIFVGVGSSGNAGIYSSTLGKWIVSTDGTTTHVDNALPLTGGTVTGPIWVKRATDSYVQVLNTTNNYSCTLDAWNNNVGLYAGHLNKWIIRNDGTTTTVDNTIPATAGAVKTTNLADKAVTAAKIGTDVTYSTIGLSASQVRTIYIGTSAPSSSTGSNGDIYLTYS